MSDNADCNGALPPGWELRYDIKSKKNYYIDNYNRTTTYDDPRPRYRTLLQQQSRQGSPSHSSVSTGEFIPLQHGSNTVYPCQSTYPPPPQPAFQLPPTPFSQLAPSSYLYQEFGSASGRPSPVLGRMVTTVMGANAFQQRAHYPAESSNTDELVAKINATFPTASETNIRMLLKKYHNREAVVMSALQVEKHPIATPGPYSTPPLARNFHHSGAYTPIQMTPPTSHRGTPSLGVRSNVMGTPLRGGLSTPPLGVRGSPPTRGSSPLPRPGSAASSSYYGSPRFGDYRQSPRTQSSPKMKLRYLKNTFPKADETLLLDVLASEDNNVMKATEKLKTMGFEKRVTPPPPPRLSSAGMEDDELSRKEAEREKVEAMRPTPPPRMKSLEEKAKMKSRLEGLYSDIPERLIQIAIESAEFDEEKARQLLMLMVHEEKENQPLTESGIVVGAAENTADVAKAQLEVDAGSSSTKKPSPRKTPSKGKDDKRTGDVTDTTKSDLPKISRGTSTADDKDFRSPFVQRAGGRNTSLRKGPNDQLLLVDYVTWHGPNSELLSGKAGSLAKGPNKANLGEKRFLAKGPNKDLRKGAVLGLAKGSIYSQLSTKTESRGQ